MFLTIKVAAQGVTNKLATVNRGGCWPKNQATAESVLDDMSEIFEIAYAAVSKQLCLFTGTGFSKAVSEGVAPSWQGLLEAVCDQCPNPVALKESLFPAGGLNPLSLEESAQVLSIELNKVDLSLHQEVASLIKAVALKGDNSSIEAFFTKQSFRVVTTNYDKLLESLTSSAETQSLTPGLPVPRSSARVKVYHVHGSIDAPENMVVTSDDYFRFINSESYFSRKLSTALHENTVVILGYSLGDTNLKSILSDYKGFSRTHTIGSNIFLVSRSPISSYVKDYYAHCYGIRVIDGVEVRDFFTSLNSKIPEAEKVFEESIGNIRKVVFDKHQYLPTYLTLENSFYEIVAALGAVGLSIDDPRVVAALGKIIESKVDLTRVDGAWEQYEHLASWLVYLASILELRGTSIENTYLTAALRSMNRMSNKLVLGYSWHAYRSWSSKWSGIIADNRSLIRKYVVDNGGRPDAISVVNRG